MKERLINVQKKGEYYVIAVIEPSGEVNMDIGIHKTDNAFAAAMFIHGLLLVWHGLIHIHPKCVDTYSSLNDVVADYMRRNP